MHLTLSALWNAEGRKSHPGKAHLPQRRPCAFQALFQEAAPVHAPASSRIPKSLGSHGQ